MPLPRRFDRDLMQAPRLQPEADAAALAPLRAWCEAGAFTPVMQACVAASVAPSADLDALACALDGSVALARLSRAQGLAWRLQLLLQELQPGHRPQAGEPWDCGWWRDAALSAAAAFRPRRATLLMVREPTSEAAMAGLSALLATLQAASAAYRRPLRVLVQSQLPLPGLPRPGPGGGP
jgi:hypothetical protein